MKSFFEKDNFNLSDIQHLIDNKVEEGIFLEFKAAEALSVEPKKKASVGIDTSAFANAAGGCLIYGLKQDEHGRADKLDFVDSSKFSKDWLQSIIDSNIQRNIPNLVIHSLSKPGSNSKQIFVVKIPSSRIGPHMAKDNRYYRRTNKGNNMLEEIDVREHYFRVHESELAILPIIGTQGGFNSPYNFHIQNSKRDIFFHLKFNIKNIGTTIEHHYKFEFSVPSGLSGYGMGYTTPIHYKSRNEGNRHIYSVGNQHPIFQEETIQIAETYLKITHHNYGTFENAEIKLKLYLPNKICSQEFKLKNILTIKEHLLDINSFSLKD